MRLAVRLVAAALAFAAPLAGACGSRTGLLVPSPPADAAAEDSSVDVVDAAEEAEPETGFPDVTPVDICPDAGSTVIYTITEQGDLYSFYPPTLAFTFIGSIQCASATNQPFSMAVDRAGIGYSVFQDGTLHVIDMATAACKDTTFIPDQDGFLTFGMGFVANTGDAGETLFVAEGDVTMSPRPNSLGLATIDTTSLALRFVAPFQPPNPGPELTGTSSGQLFGFYTNNDVSGSHIIQIDPETGEQLQDFPLMVGSPIDGYAFGYWGGVFWVFTTPDGVNTTVTRFDPATSSETNVMTLNQGVVGAGVSTCAPQ